MPLSVADIVALFETRGARMYGREPVTQRDHSLQCALLAEQAGAAPELVAACLLHDIGHLLAIRDGNQDNNPIASNIDDVHQYFALPFLRSLFPDAVLEPVRLHVDAKRYLCQVESAYWMSLSEASKQSLELQGGVYSRSEAEAFIGQPFAYEAVLLRRWDDHAKVPGLLTPDIHHFSRSLEACAA